MLLKKLLQPIDYLATRLKVWFTDDYDAETYWRKRLSHHQLDLRGVGHVCLSTDENEEAYLRAQETLMTLCTAEGIDLGSVRILDVGCGTGYYADVFRRNGVSNYTGVDITDTLFEGLRTTFPEFRFMKLDVSTQPLIERYDLIIMIDVTQHIVRQEKFSFALQNVRAHLNRGGVFIVTSSLGKESRNGWHTATRPMSAFLREFPGFQVSKPIPFRDKFIFSIRQQA